MRSHARRPSSSTAMLKNRSLSTYRSTRSTRRSKPRSKYQDRFPNVKNATRRDYYAMTSALDDAVGTIVDAVEQNHLSDNTLVIFLNDNGGPIYTGVQDNGPLKLGKLFLFEGGIRVPMVMKWPGVLPEKQVFDGTTSSLDIFPTVCAAAGIELPASIPTDGVDLIPFLRKIKRFTPRDILLE